MRKNIITAIALVLLGVMITGCTSAEYDSEIVLKEVTETEAASEYSAADYMASDELSVQNQTENIEEKIVIYVCGAVANPGVYELPAGSRANDAVIAAGGFSEEADDSFVNLAALLPDGSKLFIPTKEETENGSVQAGEGSFDTNTNTETASNCGGSGLIDINRASKEELKTIPGIGDGIAGKIIDYREKNGKFTAIEDIMKVSGIKEKLFSKIKEYITV